MRSKVSILTAFICGIALIASSINFADAANASDIAYNSQGQIIFTNDTPDTSDDIIFDASDFVKISNIVISGKDQIASAINSYSSVSTASSDMTHRELAQLVESIDNGTSASEKYILQGTKVLADHMIVSGTMKDYGDIGEQLITDGSEYILQEGFYNSGVIKSAINSPVILEAVNNKLSSISGASGLSTNATNQEIATAITAYWPGGAPTPNITYEYHKHTTVGEGESTSSSSSTYGGCYTSTVYNKHYHSGSSSSGGGCYGGYVSGHSHSSSCYHRHTAQTGSCYLKSTTKCDGRMFTYVDGGAAYCPKCGACSFTQGDGATCNRNVDSYTLICTKDGTLECGQSESSGYYYCTCGMTSGYRYASEGVDYYEPACGKTPDTIVKATIIYD